MPVVSLPHRPPLPREEVQQHPQHDQRRINHQENPHQVEKLNPIQYRQCRKQKVSPPRPLAHPPRIHRRLCLPHQQGRH
jgi:hypothetical protein